MLKVQKDHEKFIKILLLDMREQLDTKSVGVTFGQVFFMSDNVKNT